MSSLAKKGILSNTQTRFVSEKSHDIDQVLTGCPWEIRLTKSRDHDVRQSHSRSSVGDDLGWYYQRKFHWGETYWERNDKTEYNVAGGTLAAIIR